MNGKGEEIKEVKRGMPKTKKLGIFADRKDAARRAIRSRMAAADLKCSDLVRRKIFSEATFYARLRDAGDIRLEELWQMEQAGVRFSNEDLLSMFGRGSA